MKFLLLFNGVPKAIGSNAYNAKGVRIEISVGLIYFE